MRWYFWIIIYTIIFAGIAFVVIPDKSILFSLSLIALIAGLVLLLQHWPEKWLEKEKDKEG